MNASVQKNPVRTMVLRMLAGAVVGAAAMGLFLAFVGDPLLEMDDPAVALASITGVIYLTTALMVWFGLAVPRVGARFLNVEDAEELREERGKLGTAVFVMLLTGAFLLILALADRIGREASLIASLACLAGIAVGAWLSARRYDELMRRLGLEAASLTLQLAMLLFGAWAALAQLGYIEWLTPLATVSALAVLQLASSFIVVGRHGMLMPR
jgi:hypothetical protein